MAKFEFNPEEWFTLNTYDRNFKLPPAASGVYLLVHTDITLFDKSVIHNILYVGSSNNLQIRYGKHEVLRALKKTYNYIQFFFLEKENFKAIEKELIKSIQPKYNTQWL